AAEQAVVAAAANEDVVAGLAVQRDGPGEGGGVHAVVATAAVQLNLLDAGKGVGTQAAQFRWRQDEGVTGLGVRDGARQRDDPEVRAGLDQLVIAVAAVEGVVAVAASERVVTGPALKLVVAQAAGQGVVAATAIQPVVPGVAVELVGAVAAL